MKDFATSDNPAVQAELDRLAELTLPQGRFGLETIRELLDRLGNPQRRIPPAFHVAGTNGKGSTCAYLRAILEAEGLTVHTATKPHLVRYNERIRVAGELISDEMLARLLRLVLDLGEDLSPSFFEVTTAAMFLAFAEVPANACVIEVGLGGRFDATNVLETAVACGIASLGIDHEAFLLRPEAGVPVDPLVRIAFEKASIASPGVPLVTQSYPSEVAREIKKTATARGAPLFMRDADWRASASEDGITYRDQLGDLILPLPMLPGAHQADNAALAVAMIRHQNRIRISEAALERGVVEAVWPARLQLLGSGPLTELVPNRLVWLDGGHNPDAGQAIARFFAAEPGEERPPIHLVLGMLANKNPAAILRPLEGILASVTVVPAPGHEAHRPADFRPHTKLPVKAFETVPEALRAIEGPGDVLIAGSLYLAGEVLRLNREIPR